MTEEYDWIAENSWKIIIVGIFIAIFLMCIFNVRAEPLQKYYGVTNKALCIEAYNSFKDSPYMKNIKFILYFQREEWRIVNGEKSRLYAEIWNTNTIYIYQACDIETLPSLKHELGHRCQYDKKEMLSDLMSHNTKFRECYDEV